MASLAPANKSNFKMNAVSFRMHFHPQAISRLTLLLAGALAAGSIGHAAVTITLARDGGVGTLAKRSGCCDACAAGS